MTRKLRHGWSAIFGLLVAVGCQPAWGQEREAEGTWARIASEERALDTWPALKSQRGWLEERGLTLWGRYAGETFVNTWGGQRTHDSLEYRGLLDLGLELDSGKLGLWGGGLLRVQFQTGHGRGITEAVGAAQCVSNLEADDFAQLSALNYRQGWHDGNLWVQAGKQDANDEFAASEHAAAFLHSSAGFPPTIPLPSYPDQEWGALGGAKAFDVLEIKLGVFLGDPDGGRSFGRTVSNRRAPLVVGQLALEYEVFGLAGKVQLGGFHSNDRFEDLEDPLARRRRGNAGLFAIWDQWLWREQGDGSPTQGLALFSQYGWSRADRSEIEHYGGVGLLWRGALPSRDHDELGLAVYHARFSRYLDSNRASETAVEVFYTLRVARWLAFTPDVQYWHHPGGTSSEALGIGVRITLEL